MAVRDGLGRLSQGARRLLLALSGNDLISDKKDLEKAHLKKKEHAKGMFNSKTLLTLIFCSFSHFDEDATSNIE